MPPRDWGGTFEASGLDILEQSDLQDPSGAYPENTAVTETPDRLTIQSLHAKGLGWLPR